MKAYKFRAAAQIAFAFDIIINRRLYCADWKNLNDPMEGMFAYSYSHDQETEAQRIVKGVVESKNKYKVCSLSGTYDCHLLWSHYAGGFDGVAIEMNLPEGSRSIRPVEYRGVYAYLDLADVKREDDAARTILFSKYKEWEYEREIRILSDSEWYYLENPVTKVIAGPRMPDALFKVMNITCCSLGIEFCKVGIGDEGIDADYVEPPSGLDRDPLLPPQKNVRRRR
ncbi:DUF2971 domain-containing protein [Azospirillum doebereinerae]|uniref:DUF2971 domain-containing protein n=1 Tax=Azospirillum doebereinerae TaxID=92933 RepID=A0A3S0X9A8_9PROT|nr:DUF2971 domain-containing protein [Azospirillum doebereinerae]RUQ67475.1 DUF2971 domain-containing protein [Azospirillum doebereinerae]